MNSWFTVKVKYTKQLDDGALKRVTEPYLLAALSFTDAEARIYEELGTSIRGEFMVTGITRTELHDIFAYDDSDAWYKCKVVYENFDADTEKSKKVSQNFLVSANSVKQAYERIEESLKGMLVDFKIPSIVLSPIVEIFPFNEELDREIERRPLEEEINDEIEEERTQGKGVVFSAPGEDIDDDIEDTIESP